MKIKLKNLGALRQAEFELGDMTILCGRNNTGKTYATSDTKLLSAYTADAKRFCKEWQVLPKGLK